MSFVYDTPSPFLFPLIFKPYFPLLGKPRLA